jgi:hypothetical protein
LKDDVLAQIFSQSLPLDLIENHILRDIPETDLQPFLYVSGFDDPSPSDIHKNLAFIQAIHLSGSWAVTPDMRQRMNHLEEGPTRSQLSVQQNDIDMPPIKKLKMDTPESDTISFPSYLRDQSWTLPIPMFRFGTEIIEIGDIVRLMTNYRKTRNLVISPTYLVLLVTYLTFTSDFDATTNTWIQRVVIKGDVCEPHAIKNGYWVTTGEIRTVDPDGISGRWYKEFPKLSRRMPVTEQELWTGIGIRNS